MYHLKWTSDGLSCSDKPCARSVVCFINFSSLSCASDVFGQTWWDPNDRTGCFTCVNFFNPKTKMTQTEIHHRQSYVDHGLPGNWKTLCRLCSKHHIGRWSVWLGQGLEGPFMKFPPKDFRRKAASKIWMQRVHESMRRVFVIIIWHPRCLGQTSPTQQFTLPKFLRHVMIVGHLWTRNRPNYGIDTATEG